MTSTTMDEVFETAIAQAREYWVKSPWTSARDLINERLRKRVAELLATEEFKAKVEQIALAAITSDEGGLSTCLQKEVFGNSDWYRRQIFKDAIDGAVKNNQPQIDAIFAKLIDERGQAVVEELFKNMLGTLAHEVAAKACTALFGEIGTRTMRAIQNAQHTTRW